jgi:hypothetical protein
MSINIEKCGQYDMFADVQKKQRSEKLFLKGEIVKS